MLPAVSNFKTKSIAALIAFTIALPAPALAWGQREQDGLKGAAAALIIAGIINNAQRHQPQQAQPEIYIDQPYYAPRPSHHRPSVQEQPRVSIYRTAAARGFNSYSMSERRLIQRQLAAYGFYNGRFDGSFGPGTYSGVVAYARSQGQSGALRSMNQVFSVYDGLIY